MRTISKNAILGSAKNNVNETQSHKYRADCSPFKCVQTIGHLLKDSRKAQFSLHTGQKEWKFFSAAAPRGGGGEKNWGIIPHFFFGRVPLENHLLWLFWKIKNFFKKKIDYYIVSYLWPIFKFGSRCKKHWVVAVCRSNFWHVLLQISSFAWIICIEHKTRKESEIFLSKLGENWWKLGVKWQFWASKSGILTMDYRYFSRKWNGLTSNYPWTPCRLACVSFSLWF